MTSTTTLTSDRWRGQPLTMGQLGHVLLRHWILLVVGLLVGGLAGLGVAKLTPPVYTATSTMLIKAVPGTSPAANYEAAQYAVARAKAYPVFIYNLSVLDGIRTDLGTGESTADLQADITATTIADTPLVQITAKGSTPAEARDKANAALRQLSRFIVQIETVNGRSPISVDVAVLAASKPVPTSPRPLLYMALGAVGGLALAITIALAHAYVRESRLRRGVTHRRRGGPAPRHSTDSDARVPSKVDAHGDEASILGQSGVSTPSTTTEHLNPSEFEPEHSQGGPKIRAET